MSHPGIRYDPTRYMMCSTRVFNMIHHIIQYEYIENQRWITSNTRLDHIEYQVGSHRIHGWLTSYTRVDHIEYPGGSHRMPGWIISNTWLDHIVYPGGSYRIPGWIIPNTWGGSYQTLPSCKTHYQLIHILNSDKNHILFLIYLFADFLGIL